MGTEATYLFMKLIARIGAITYLLLFWHKLKQFLNAMGKEQTPWGKEMSQGDSSNNAHLGPNLPSHHKTATSSNKTLDTPNLTTIPKNIFISNDNACIYSVLRGSKAKASKILQHRTIVPQHSCLCCVLISKRQTIM